MSFWQDRHTKGFFIFLLFFIFSLFLAGMELYIIMTDNAKSMLLSHDSSIAASLLNQGVSKDVIATALTGTKESKESKDFITVIGLTQRTKVKWLPHLFEFQQENLYDMIKAGLLLTLLLLVGSWVFFWQQERMYKWSQNIIESYIDGNYSIRLSQTREGSIYQMFASIERLATMLHARNEREYRTKEFLKNTISDISHQFKTPLAALSMYQEIIESEPDNVDLVKEFSSKIGNSVERMKQLIQSMLKITRLDAENIVFDKSKYKVRDMILHSLNELGTRAESEKKEIILEGNSEEVMICDMEWTREAIGNIVKNALDHTNAGGIIRISWEGSPTMVRIIISDNGDGIAKEDIHHIFKRFYRSKNSLDTQGVGLGLSLAKAIVEGQGGVITIQSNINKGTTFIISFLTEL